MLDYEIISLYQNRDEGAIEETIKKYSSYCYSISKNILDSQEDVEECVNDTYHKVWCAIPPSHPEHLRVFIGSITRRLSINRYKKNKAKKRNFGRMDMVLDELTEVIEDVTSSLETKFDQEEIQAVLNDFLKTLPKKQRIIFVKRYWHVLSIKDISVSLGISETNTKQILYRVRKKLKKNLEKAGVEL